MAAKRGGKREGAGRKPGTVSRATREQKGTLSSLARKHTAAALATLVRVMAKGESDAVQLAAANSILDRGYGKPGQSHEHTGKNGGAISTIDLTGATDDQIRALEAVFGPLAESGDDDGGDQG